jgi:hypothetical protein
VQEPTTLELPALGDLPGGVLAAALPAGVVIGLAVLACLMFFEQAAWERAPAARLFGDGE